MSRFGVSATIIRHSYEILEQNPKLLVFVLLNVLGMLVALVFFFAPVALGVTTADLWLGLWNPAQVHDPAVVSLRAAKEAARGIWRNGPLFGELAGIYLLGMFFLTFVNTAFCSQVIAAMNGDRVSVRRGLAEANARLPAIVAWALLTSTIGIVLRLIAERVAFVGRSIVGLLGISWSVASVFVIPVLLHEPRTRSPFAYLKISAALIRRVWGEGVAGFMDVEALSGRLSGFRTFMLFVVMPLVAIGMMAAMADSLRVFFFPALLVYIVGMLANQFYQVFVCGLYVYATQGVAPGSFDAETFDRVWTAR